MGIFKFVAKKISIGPAVKVWVDAYNILFERNDNGLVNTEKAENYFNYIKRMNILADRDGDISRNITFENLEVYLEKPDHLNFNPLLDLPSFLAIMMFFEIRLIREAFRNHPDKANLFLEIIYEVTCENAPNGLVLKKNEFIKLANDRLQFISSTLSFIY